MAAHDHLNQTLFHGTTHWFSPGDTVEPTDTLHTLRPSAYATPHPEVADQITGYRASKGKSRATPGQGQLFGPVYEVEHQSEPQTVRQHLGLREPENDAEANSKRGKASSSAIDQNGFTVKRLSHFASYKGDRI